MQIEVQSGTRPRIVEAARKLFWSNGYEATSLGDVAEKSGAKTGSVYYFFKSKEELLLAVLDRYTELLWPVVIEPAFQRTEDPIERIFAILEGYRQGLIMTNFTHGCPLGNLALEVGDVMPRARELIGANFRSWRGWIRRCLQDAAERLPAETDLDALAVFILSVMEGGVMQSRVHQSLRPFEQSVAQLRNYFDSLLQLGAQQAAAASQPDGFFTD